MKAGRRIANLTFWFVLCWGLGFLILAIASGR